MLPALTQVEAIPAPVTVLPDAAVATPCHGDDSAPESALDADDGPRRSAGTSRSLSFSRRPPAAAHTDSRTGAAYTDRSVAPVHRTAHTRNNQTRFVTTHPSRGPHLRRTCAGTGNCETKSTIACGSTPARVVAEPEGVCQHVALGLRLFFGPSLRFYRAPNQEPLFLADVIPVQYPLVPSPPPTNGDPLARSRSSTYAHIVGVRCRSENRRRGGIDSAPKSPASPSGFPNLALRPCYPPRLGTTPAPQLTSKPLGGDGPQHAPRPSWSRQRLLAC